MKIQFKPMLWPSIFSILIFSILISFGTWQVKRLFWKQALIENYLTQSQSNPITCLLYTSPSPRDYAASRMPSSA